MLAQIINYLFPAAITEIDYRIQDDGDGSYISYWNPALGPQPTEQEITDTQVSAGFLTWLAEHGGDPLMTLRRQAREYIDAQDEATANTLRAFMLIVLDELNIHAQRVTAILDAIDSANNLAQLQTNIGVIADVPQRTASQLRTALKNKITAGDSDS